MSALYTLKIRIKMKHHFYNLIILLLFVLLQVACSLVSSPSNNEDYDLKDHKSISFNVDSKNVTSPLSTEQYTIDSIRPIITTDDFGTFDATKIYVNNKKIFILDSDIAKTILVFNLKGQYLYKLGEIGRAKNEYISAPADFFVSQNGDVHVFDSAGQKILIFDWINHKLYF